jgi:hypothetical protein
MYTVTLFNFALNFLTILSHHLNNAKTVAFLYNAQALRMTHNKKKMNILTLNRFDKKY